MASRRPSASAPTSAMDSDSAAYQQQPPQQQQQQQQQQRRGGARFLGALVEPSRAAQLLQRSPVNTAAAACLKPQHSTPQPTRRNILSLLFRGKTSSRSTSRGLFDDDRDSSAGVGGSASASAVTSPASHQSTPTHHHHPPLATGNERFLRSGSGGSGLTATATTAATEEPRVLILLEGALTNLSSHKYWHAKATYYVLEESTIGSPEAPRSCVCLKQFKKKPASQGQQATPLSVIPLTEFDVVVDISDRYIKHGLELFHRAPAAAHGPSSSSSSSVSSRAHCHPAHETDLEKGEPLKSLRLSVDDNGAHRKWMRALGSAIARLIDQSKRHYPITPAHANFVREKTTVYEPEAASAIVATAVPVRSSFTAKVAPMAGHYKELMEDTKTTSIDEEEQKQEEENQHDGGGGDGRQEEEMRVPEEPEIHSDHRSSLSSIQSDGGGSGDGLSDAWASPHSHYSSDNDDNNNNNDTGRHRAWEDGGHNNQRSSNQLDESDDDSESHSHQYQSEAMAFAQRASEASYQISPSGTNSLASTPSPFARSRSAIHSTMDGDEDSQTDDIHALAASMAASSLSASGELGTPPSPSPPPPAHVSPAPPVSADKPAYIRQYQGLPGSSSSSGRPLLRPHVHSFNANGQVFTLDVRYELLKSIGNGAYGAVIAAKDLIVDTSVAVKKITNIFDDLVDAKRILREVRLLRHFHHKNITELLDLAPPQAKKSFEDMYIITELMETDLHQVIYSMQPMSDDHVKYFLYQMLCALYHIHSAGVLHRDMKPSNILLNSNCDLKVCDFGLARGGMDASTDAKRLAHSQGSAVNQELTEYVVTRWYRAPEIMLNCLQYTAAIDVWAVGCIFAEMLLREPLFPGNDYIHQLKLIIKFLGTPKQEDTAFVKNAKALRFLTKLSISKPRKWREVFAGEEMNPLALDLLAQMLIFNPEKRISVEKALQHPYLATFYDPADISRAQQFEFGFDLPDDKLSKEALVDLLCEDISCFHPLVMQNMKQPPVSHFPLPTPMVPRPPMMAGTAPGAAGSSGGSSNSNRYFGMTASAS